MVNNRIAEFGDDILKDKKYDRLKEYIQHGSVSVQQHSLRVAELSLRISDFMKRFHVRLHDKELVRGALLHDYFLYDWHKRPLDIKQGFKGMHGFSHPSEALRNAERDYELTKREKDIIEKHMFPLTLTRVPFYREAWVVTLADKYCSLVETVTMRKKRPDISDSPHRHKA